GAAFHAGAILKLLVQRLRQAWSKVQIIFRGDAGFCIPKILSWSDRHQVDYVVGISTNPRLVKKSELTQYLARRGFELYSTKHTVFSSFYYAAYSWSQHRRVVVKAEHDHRGANTRFVVTSLEANESHIYKKMYCARGDMENRIKEQKLLFSDRTSCHHWWPNQFRILLSSMAYTLVEALRRLALKKTILANA
ncbi:transposase, partial [Zooshikella harenae]